MQPAALHRGRGEEQRGLLIGRDDVRGEDARDGGAEQVEVSRPIARRKHLVSTLEPEI
jgi:hypothetical protein